MKNYGTTSNSKDIQTKSAVENIVLENGAFFSIEDNDTPLSKSIPTGGLILVVSTRQLLTNTEELTQGRTLEEQSDKILVAGGITWETFNE